MSRARSHLALLPAFALAACGGDDAPTTPDAGPGPDAGGCALLADPIATISAYPGEVTGQTVGAGADVSVAEGVCANEVGYYEPVGDDVVVALTNLEAGGLYAVIVDATEDLGFYVVTGCADGTIGDGECLAFDDQGSRGESSTFTAPADGRAFVVVDSANFGGTPPTTGAFTLTVAAAECEADAGCGGATPRCVDFACVECATSLDCGTAALPFCDAATNACTAGPAECSGDDPGDTAPGDDGPAAARSIAAPSAGVPTVTTASVCSQPAGERDWYEVTLPAGTFGLELDWTVTAAQDLDVYVRTAEGAPVASGVIEGTDPEALRFTATAGTYLVEVQQYAPAASAAATPYTLTLRVAECEDAFGCTGTAPICSASGTCGAGPAACVDDDAGDTTGAGDDGPLAGRDLTAAVDTPATLPGAACNSPATEADWYAVTVADGESLALELAWTGEADFDLAAFDADGRLVGLTYWKQPERIDLTYLPAGTYYVRVTLFSESPSATMPTTASVPYTLTATRGAAAACTGAADCAAAFGTQLYRGHCDAGTGACAFLATTGADAGAPCDANDNCASGQCSYVAFEADAQDSVCSQECATNADCASLAGTTCLAAAFCVPACTTNLECGVADTNSSTITSGQAWDYMTCAPATGVCTP